jgi:hypothetical protein
MTADNIIDERLRELRKLQKDVELQLSAEINNLVQTYSSPEQIIRNSVAEAAADPGYRNNLVRAVLNLTTSVITKYVEKSIQPLNGQTRSSANMIERIISRILK